MILYSVDFGHWSQKDSQRGIKGYLLAGDDENVLDWLIANDSLNNTPVWTFWGDKIQEKPKKRERLLKKRGELYDNKALDGLSDLYYGATLYGWTAIREVSEAEASALLTVGVAVQA